MAMTKQLQAVQSRPSTHLRQPGTPQHPPDFPQRGPAPGLDPRARHWGAARQALLTWNMAGQHGECARSRPGSCI